MAKIRTIGNRIAPARFLIFFAMLAATIAAATLIAPWWRSVMMGFDLSALAFILGCIPLYNDAPDQMRKAAEAKAKTDERIADQEREAEQRRLQAEREALAERKEAIEAKGEALDIDKAVRATKAKRKNQS